MNPLQKARSIYYTILEKVYEKREHDQAWPLSAVGLDQWRWSMTTGFTMLAAVVALVVLSIVYQSGGKRIIEGLTERITPTSTYDIFIPTEKQVAAAMMPAMPVSFQFKKKGPVLTVVDSTDQTVDVHLSVTGYGYQNKPEPIGSADIKRFRNRVEYRYDRITEWYHHDPYGLEQGFTLWLPPAGLETSNKWRWFRKKKKTDRGTVVIELALESELTAVMDKKGEGINFRSADQENSDTLLRYSKILAWDDLGRLLPVQLELKENKKRTVIELYVDVSDALWPVFIS
ncbi:MAG: hypothetical protein HKM24_07395 [Gammaproteobacteria bacterium]|nr:hypothetical protein [Gammaproteobacteria bacterium]